MNFAAVLLEIVILVCSAQTPDPAPALTLEGIDGRTVAIQPARLGKPLVVHLFSTQTAGWQGELLRLKELNARFSSQSVAVVSVAAAAPQALEILRAFAVENKIEFPVALDRSGAIFSDLGDDKIPDVALISPDGNVVLRLYGAFDAAQAQTVSSRLPELIEQGKVLAEAAKKAARKRALHEKEVAEAAGEIKPITPDELKARLGSPLNLYYIGPAEAFGAKHIPGAIQLDYGRVEKHFEDKDRNQEFIFYCGCDHNKLGASGRVAAELHLKGFARATYLEGHLQTWEKMDYPLERRGERK